jgi:hypothetical protein
MTMGIRRRGFLGHPGRCRRCRNEDIDLEADQLGDERGEPVDLAVGVSNLDNNVLALDPAPLVQSLPKRGEQVLMYHGAVLREVPYSRYSSWLLCLDGERQAEKRTRHRTDKSAPIGH